MHRTLSLLALGITLALTAAEPMVSMTIKSIKAVDVMRDNKDQWRVKGYLNDPDGVTVPLISDEGVTLGLENGNQDTVANAVFNVDDCKLLNNDKGIVCKVKGARISLKRLNRVPKDAVINAQHNKNKTSGTSSYYTISGTFRHQQFENTLSKPLTVIAGIGGEDLEDTNYACKEKTGSKATKLFCKPGTATPTPGPTFPI